MLETLKDILGMGEQPNYGELIQQGAIILDVRTQGEFLGGHVKNAINIPVDQLNQNLSKLKDKNKCIICCCASGARSASAKRVLISKGYETVYNAGGWIKLQSRL